MWRSRGFRARHRQFSTRLERHHHVAFPARLREDILRLATGVPTTTEEISRLNFALGENLRGLRLRLAASGASHSLRSI